MGLITDSNLHSEPLETEQAEQKNNEYGMEIFENEAPEAQVQSKKFMKKKRAGTIKKNSKIKDMIEAKRGS